MTSTCFIINHDRDQVRRVYFGIVFRGTPCISILAWICGYVSEIHMVRSFDGTRMFPSFFLSLSSSIRFWFTYRFIELQVLFYLRVSHLLFSFRSSVFGFLATFTLIFAARDERMQILHYKRGFKGTVVLFYFTRSIDLVVNFNIYFIYLEKINEK